MTIFKKKGLYIDDGDNEWIEIGDFAKRLKLLEDKVQWLWDNQE